MAPENVKGKKRKGAADASPKPKKLKKSTEATVTKKSPAKLKKSVDTSTGTEPSKTKAPRPRSEDMWDEDVQEEGSTEKKPKKDAKAVVNGDSGALAEKPKKSKKTSAKDTNKDAAPESEAKEQKKAKKDESKNAATEKAVSAATENKKAKKDKKSKVQETPKEPSPEVEDQNSESGEEEDDQTAALLAGFESDRDESDADREDEGLDEDNFKDKVPKGLLKKTKAISGKGDKRGVIFVGRIPHGFYESQMKAYFSQFGKVTRLRVSRNKKTGAPKHYAFVEFASAEVAEIVAKTMDKYLMFGHILQCSVIPDEQVHPNLFVGANQRFKKMPRNKIAGAEMMRGAERAVWEKRVAHEKKRRSLKEKILKEKLGYDYEAPTLKAVEDVPKKATGLEGAPAQQLLTEAQAVEETTPKPIEELKAAHNDAENPKPKKSMKAGKRKADAEADTLDAAQVHDVEAKAPKSKKAKAAAVEPEQVEGVKEKKKAKKEAKKAPVEEITKEKKRKSLGSDDINGSKAKKTKKAKA